jgi:hypothetical protein
MSNDWKIPSLSKIPSRIKGPTSLSGDETSAAATRSSSSELVSPLVSDRDVKRRVQEQRDSDSAACASPSNLETVFYETELEQLRSENRLLQAEISKFVEKSENFRAQAQDAEELRGEILHLSGQNLFLQQQLNSQQENIMAAAAPILDNVLTPKMFAGDGDDDANEWIEFFDNYVKFRKLEFDDVKRLLPLFLKSSAKEWFRAVMAGEHRPTTTDALVTAFKAKFKPSGATKWKSRSELWQRQQRGDERVGPYIESMKSVGRRLALDEETIMWAIMNGLREEIRPNVIERNPKDLDELKTQAELSESARCSAGSAGIEGAIRRLESRLDSLSVSNVSQLAGRGSDFGRDSRRFDRRCQRRPWRRSSWTRAGGATSRERYSAQSGSYQPCRACGRNNSASHQCRERMMECRICGVRGHVMRVCPERSDRPTNGRRSPSASPSRSLNRKD